MDVYVEKNRERTGPFTADQIVEMIKDGSLAPTQMVWHEQLSDWQLASTVFDFSEAGSKKREAEKAAAAAKTGKKTSDEFSFSFDRRAAQQDGTVSDAPAELAGRGLRFAAALLDSAIAGVAGLPGIVMAAPAYFTQSGGPVVLGGTVMVLGLIAVVIIQIVLLSKHGQTMGKKVLKIRIVRVDNDGNPGFAKAVLLRAVVPGLIGAVPAVGSIFSLVDILFIFRSDKRCIHDLIAGTRVVAGGPPESPKTPGIAVPVKP